MRKKTLSLADLKKLAKEVFEANPDADKAFATADGNIFLPKAKNAAELHAKSEKIRLYVIDNENFHDQEEIDEDEDSDDDPFNDADSEAEKGSGNKKTAKGKGGRKKAVEKKDSLSNDDAGKGIDEGDPGADDKK